MTAQSKVVGPGGRPAFQQRAASRRRAFRNPHCSRKILFRDLPRRGGFLMRSTPYSYRRTQWPLQPPAAPAGKIPLNQRLAVVFQKPFRIQRSRRRFLVLENRKRPITVPQILLRAPFNLVASLSDAPSQSRQKPLPAQRKRRGFLMRPALYLIAGHKCLSIGPNNARQKPHRPAHPNGPTFHHSPVQLRRAGISSCYGKIMRGLTVLQSGVRRRSRLVETCRDL
jgi:hypothetical protein